MKRIYILLLLFSFSVRSNSQPAKNVGDSAVTHGNWAVFHHSETNISFKYPSDWDTSSNEKIYFILRDKQRSEKDPFIENIIFSRLSADVPLDWSLDTLISVVTRGVVKKHTNCELKQHSVFKNPNGILVGMFEISFLDGGIEKNSIQTYFRKNGKVFAIGFSSENSQTNMYRPLLREVINSIKY